MEDNHLFIDEDHLSKDSGISEEEGATSTCLSLENTSKCKELFEQYSDLFEQEDTNGDEDSLLSKNLDLDCFKFPILDLEHFKNECGKKSSTGSGSSFSSSKEEKEKQNEELIIMKATNNLNFDREEIKESCKDFLLTERIFSSQNLEIPKVIPMTSCFIDASSLLDDDTISPFLNGNFSLKDDSVRKIVVDDKKIPEIYGSGEFTEKFLTKKYSLSHEGRSNSHPEENGLKLESIFNSENDLTKLRQEQEKKQGNLVFKNSIQHFSQHFIDPDEKLGLIESNLSSSEKGFSFLPDTPHNSIITTDGCRFHYGKQFDDNISDVKFEEVVPIPDSYGDERNKQQELTKNMVWTIDMNKSDESVVKKKRTESPEIPTIEQEQETRKSSLGFFVDLSDVVKTTIKKSNEKLQTIDFMLKKKSTGFYVDLSDESNSSTEKQSIDEKLTIPSSNDDKKPFFSLFIDFGENKTIKKPIRYDKKMPEHSPPPLDEEINNRTVSITSDSSNIENDSSNKTETNDFSSNHDFTQINDETTTRTNATFNKSSPDSITDEIFSKDSSPIQQEIDKLNSLPVILEDKKCNIEKEKKAAPTHTMETLQATVERQRKLLESTTNTVDCDSLSFVKLSDMDKPVAAVVMPKYKSKKMSSSVETGFGYSLNTLKRNFMFSNEINSYMSQSTGNNITNLASTLENSRSLTRLFPHLSKGEF